MSFTNTMNSQFQYIAFVAGKAHTADEAYRLIKTMRLDRESAIRHADAMRLKREAKRLHLQHIINMDAEKKWETLEAHGELLELEADEETENACYEGAKREVTFLNELLAIIEPHRKYAHLPDHEAFEACQREEWLLEFFHRIENCCLTMGTIPPDQLSAMRQHIDWHSTIFPYLMEAQQVAASQRNFPPRAWAKPPWKLMLEARANQLALPPSSKDLGVKVLAAPADPQNAVAPGN